MSSSTSYEFGRARSMWLSCLGSAIRTCIACTIVGLVTLYGPAILQRHISLPAFSYVTVILIITDATLGDTVRGCWLALYATVQSVGPAILSLWIIGPANLTTGTTVLAVALGAFVVVVPESTHLISKRIALGQIVLAYLIAFKNGVHADAIMHPADVAVSTAVGAVACVVALLFPYPRLACLQVKQKSKLYADNASQRLKLFVKIFCETNKSSVMLSLSQAKSLAAQGNKLLQCIMRMQESMQWERLPLKFLKSHYVTPGLKFKDLEVVLKGMEMASINVPFPATILKPDFKSGLEEQLNLTLKQVQNCLTSDSMTVRESNPEAAMESLQTLQIQAILPSQDNLPSLFVLFCFTLLHKDSVDRSPSNTSIQDALPDQIEGSTKAKFLKEVWCNLGMGLKKQRTMAALKCSLSLGLAVFLGVVYSKDDGIWSGLPVAISLASAREATFIVANIKAQGTVLGSVYGVLVCFIFGNFLQLRLISLFPWFVLTSFLRKGKIYGQAGGISAIIGAVLILGRKNFGLPKDFAVARIVETFIGLSCSVMVDIIFQPTRASSLAKTELSSCLAMLRFCIGSLSIQGRKSSMETENGERLNTKVNELRELIVEAEVEPNFWFLPFHSACYNKILKSISTMVDLLFYMSRAIRFLEQKSRELEAASSWKEVSDKLENNLKLFSDIVSSLFKCFEEISLIKSLALLEKQLEQEDKAHDLEMGKLHDMKKLISSGSDEDEIFKKIVCSYIEDVKESCGSKLVRAEEDVLTSRLMLCLGAIGFCINGLLRETREIEKGIKELVEWENPSKPINLYEISCKINALQN